MRQQCKDLWQALLAADLHNLGMPYLLYMERRQVDLLQKKQRSGSAVKQVAGADHGKQHDRLKNQLQEAVASRQQQEVTLGTLKCAVDNVRCVWRQEFTLLAGLPINSIKFAVHFWVPTNLRNPLFLQLGYANLSLLYGTAKLFKQ